MNYTKHKSAIVETTHIGGNTCISAYTHVLPNTEIGNNCYIEDHVVIDGHVIIGNNVKIKTGTKICEDVQIEDDVFIGPNVTFTNDKFSKSKSSPESSANIILRKGAFIGANATILPEIQIGQYAMVGAGAVVTRSIPPYAIVVGNPAKITGYIDTERQSVDRFPITHENKIESNVRGVFLKQVKMVEDLRGDITVTELAQDIPFQVRRMFFVYNVPDERVRGEHVHKELQEFIICLKGAFSIVVDDQETKEEYRLDKPNLGIYIPPTVWRSLYKFTPDAVLAVYASHEYDPTDYIRDYNEFCEMAK